MKKIERMNCVIAKGVMGWEVTMAGMKSYIQSEILKKLKPKQLPKQHKLNTDEG